MSHATPAALKLLEILDNAEIIFAIELLAAVQAYDLQRGRRRRAREDRRRLPRGYAAQSLSIATIVPWPTTSSRACEMLRARRAGDL